MKKFLLLLITLTALLSGIWYAPGAAYALDEPHNADDTVIAVNCDQCHYDPTAPPPWTSVTSSQDNTRANQLCQSCHSAGNLSDHRYEDVRTHSSYKTSNKYGTWVMECRICHQPHYQQQSRSYSSLGSFVTGSVTSVVTGVTSTVTVSNILSTNTYTNYLLIPNTSYSGLMYRITGNTADTITVMGAINTNYVPAAGGSSYVIRYGKMIKNQVATPKSGTKTVKFFSDQGPNSFADAESPADPAIDGICQVCHTRTQYFRTDATGTIHPNSKAGQNCTQCHTHRDGFRASCNSCHGNPPASATLGSPNGLADNDGGTGSPTAGAHQKHAVTLGYDCDTCHTGGMPVSAVYDKKIQIGFTLLGGAYQGGAYDGRTSLANGYSYSAGNAGTAVTNGGMMQCSNIYCHGSTMAPNGGTDVAPLWNVSSTGACGACHGATAENPPARGSHQKHAGNASSLQAPAACTACHKDYTHVNNAVEWKLDSSDARVSTGMYKGTSSGSAAMGTFPKTYGSCSTLYCHSNAAPTGTKEPNEYKAVTWGDPTSMACDSCHKGRTSDNLTMSSNGHDRLAGKNWVRKYPCAYCHNATVDADGNILDKTKHLNGAKDVVISSQWYIAGRPTPSYDKSTGCSNVYCHSDGTTNPETVRPFMWTQGRTECNTCHGHPQGSCGSSGCHDGRTDENGKLWSQICAGITKEQCEANSGIWNGWLCRGISETACTTLGGNVGWPPGQEWKAAMPMFKNQGPGSARANSHPRHLETEFQCDVCHYATIKNGTCTDCHIDSIPSGNMGEVAHIDPAYHVNKVKDVVFKNGGNYNSVTKECSNTACHSGGVYPVWGGSVEGTVICLNCHGTSGSDVDDFGSFNGVRAKINLTEWATSGHGRSAATGSYPSGNPAANFPGNPCWYCHDNNVLHKDSTNPFRLRKHSQFKTRFEKECVYCHMEGLSAECLGCHNAAESLAPQLSTLPAKADDRRADKVTPAPRPDHTSYGSQTSCTENNCHGNGSSPIDAWVHYTNAGIWTAELKADVRNQYLMMGVCLKCHEEDSNGRCTHCHTGPQYTLGFDPGTGFIKPQKARATSVHYGYKHFQQGTTKGGKFCWDCHDPHGDSNIYMIQSKVATSTDGVFGQPAARADVVFTKKQSGLDYGKTSPPYNGICNVCHTMGSQHYRVDYGDGHNSGRVCTSCHEHKFTASHASGQSCGTCHGYKPVPSHTAFGLPRDCTKCHEGVVGKRMDIMGQLRSNSHHIQGVTASNKQCYVCHWEATEQGLIDVDYHEGYNYKTHTSVKEGKVDLVILGPKTRPTPTYEPGVTAVTFLASRIGTTSERAEVANITSHCLSCHSDQNNDWQPFGDCKTPRQYAWDRSSIASRYTNTGAATWGKYTTYSNAAKKDITKAFSAHGNAAANQGGFSSTTGLDETIPNTRAGSQGVQCFDCHSSHGSKTTGTTSSYITFNGTMNGANLKETQAGKGGYGISYKAAANTSGVNPYNAGAGQCFDCHETQNAYDAQTNPAGTTPWGYQSTYGASAPIMGYNDTMRFGTGTKAKQTRSAYKNRPVIGGHLKASSNLTNAAAGAINGLCTPCHDPHGVSRSLGADMAYAVPLLKGTWLTSPYKEDITPNNKNGYSGTSGFYNYSNTWNSGYVRPYAQKGNPQPSGVWRTDRNTFNTVDLSNKANVPDSTYGRISEDDAKFAGLCLKCHPKSGLTDGVNKNTSFKSLDRIHESVKGWGANTEHSFPCAKCHQAHNSGLPRLMQTNCLDYKHRGKQASGGQPYAWDASWSYENRYGRFPYGWWDDAFSQYSTAICHGASSANGSGGWPDNQKWNNVTQW